MNIQGIMQPAYLKYFLAFLVNICFVSIVPAKANISIPITIAQAASTYDQYMRIGYTATKKRNYKTALISFRKALQLRPNDKYALRAIDNLSRYASALRGERITYVPKNTGAPANLGSGATRGCSIGGKPPIALVPSGETLTTAKMPVLLVYTPQSPGTRVEFVIQERDGEDIYKTNITSSKNAGIVSLNLATFPAVPSLENEKEYQWFLILVCNETDRSGDVFVSGLIKKVALDPLLARELQVAEPGERAALYAANGIWYDALAALYSARLSSLNDPTTSQSWANLLKSVQPDKELAIGNEKLVQQYETLPNEPLIECCQASSNREGLNP